MVFLRLMRIAVLCLTVLSAGRLSAVRLSAAERDGKTYLIIHADDAGMSHSVNRATIDAMEKGIVSSASIMVPCPWFPEIAAYARKHPEKDFGIHLTLNCEWNLYKWGPVTPRDQVPSLVDENGYLWKNVRQVAAHAKAKEVERELRAQIERAKKFGVPITHLDTHMGAVISRPDLVEIYVRLGIEYKVPVLFTRQASPRLLKAYPALAGRMQRLTADLDKHGLPILDGLAQFYGGKSQQTRRQTYLNRLKTLTPGVHQIIIHCGYADKELRAITNSAENRDGDRHIFSDPKMIAEIRKLGIHVISWKQFHKMTATPGK